MRKYGEKKSGRKEKEEKSPPEMRKRLVETENEEGILQRRNCRGRKSPPENRKIG